MEPCRIGPLVTREHPFASSTLIASPSPASSMANGCNRMLRLRPEMTTNMSSSCSTSMAFTFLLSPIRTISERLIMTSRRKFDQKLTRPKSARLWHHNKIGDGEPKWLKHSAVSTASLLLTRLSNEFQDYHSTRTNLAAKTIALELQTSCFFSKRNDIPLASPLQSSALPLAMFVRDALDVR